ncbi:MAG: hypothetical protein HY705_01330 [Gemmatimonadetes bacterium]|nr:hypothetical protein [Gemmatimonadota bacterium]
MALRPIVLAILVAAASVAAALALYLGVERVGPGGIPLALLRALAWGAVAALLVNPAWRRPGAGGVTVLLDHSLSMSDPSGSARWTEALDSARAIAGRRGRILLFGEEPRVYDGAAAPDAPSSRLLPALREAAAAGGSVAIVTDGALDDAGSVPTELLRAARVLVLPRPARPDAGIAAFELPAALRAGDTVAAAVDVVVAATSAGDTVTLELLEAGRVVSRARLAVGSGGSYRRELVFVPAAPAGTGEREVRRYEARVSGVRGDAEPRDDRRASLAVVARTSVIAVFSDSPDWDSRWLAAAVRATSGMPVRYLVRLDGGTWRDAGTLRPVPYDVVRAAATRAALVVAHGTPEGIAAISRLARGSLWRWPAGRSEAAAPGEWYVAPAESASPAGAALSGVPLESLPPLEAVAPLWSDSGAWTGLMAREGRRGDARAVVTGGLAGGRRTLLLNGAGLWRWAAKGGVAREGYRSLVAALTDWLLERQPPAPAVVTAGRDSLARGLAEFLPRPALLASQPGLLVHGADETIPLRHAGWLYWAVLGALVTEWIARRRKGLL